MEKMIEKRDLAFNEAKEILEKAKLEERSFTDEEKTKYETLVKEVETLNDVILAEKRSLDIENGLVNIPMSNSEVETTDEEKRFSNILKLEERSVDYSENVFAPKGFVNEVIRSLNNGVFVREIAKKYTLTQLEGITIPKRTGVVGNASWGDAESIDDGLDYGSVTLKPQGLNKTVKLAKKLVKFSSLPIEQEVKNELVEAYSRTLEQAYLTGNGASDTPFGVFNTTAVPVTQDVVVGTGDIEAKSFISAKNKMPSGYNPVWIIHPDVLTEIEGLKDGDGRHIFTQSFRVGEPDTILGIPVIKSDFAPNVIEADAYIAVLGDFGRGYAIADVETMEVQVLKELYAGTNQIGYKGYFLTTGNVIDEKAFVRVKLGNNT